MLCMNMSYLMGHHCQNFFITKTFDKLRIKHDNWSFNPTGKGVYYWILLHENLRHIYTQCRAGDLQLGVKVGTLLRSDCDRACRKNHANCGLSGNCQ